MRLLFIFSLLITIIFLTSSFVFVYFKENKYRINTINMLSTILICSIFFLFYNFTKNENHASLLLTFAILFFFYNLVFINQAVFRITKLKQKKAKKHSMEFSKTFKISVYVLILLNSVLILLNHPYHLLFNISPLYINDNFDSFIITKGPLIAFEIILYIFFLFVSFVHLFCKSIKSDHFYKKYYLSMAFFILIIIFLNIFLHKAGFKYDLSVFFHFVLSIIITLFNYFFLPKEENDKLMDVIASDISSAIGCFDFEGNCIYENAIARTIFNDTETEHKNIEKYIQESWLNKFSDDNSNSVYGEDKIKVHGDLRYYDIEYKKFLSKRNVMFGSYIKLIDKTSEQNLLIQEEYKSVHDILTGLYNRSTFFNEVEKKLKEKPYTTFYLIATNIKNFKFVNDLYGVKLGDKILLKQAEMLKKADYQDCVLGRISADRFGMLIRKRDFDEQKAQENTENILNITKSLNYKLKIYIGVYEITDTSEKPTIMYDKALLAIKNIHGDYEKTVSFYQSIMMDSIVKEKHILNDFANALKTKQFKMYLQPLTDKDGNCKCAEALVRWEHPNLGLLSPALFLETLEKTGYIYSLDTYMWDLAAQKLKEFKDKGFNDFSISVNISPKDFQNNNLYGELTKIVNKYQISPANLNLEITETVFMNNAEENMEIINSLKDFGFKVELDDFGSGYSSLNMMKEMYMDVLKIDMDFLHSTKNQERSYKILQTIIALANDLNIELITEGVENQKQLDFLTKAGCSQFQGFYFSKPIPPDEFERKYLGGNNG